MNPVFPHSDRQGTNAALDIVEQTLASLRKRVEKQEKKERERRVKDAATNTTPPPPPPPSSVASSKESKKPRNKSVLIKHKSHHKRKRVKHTSHSSVQENVGTQKLEEELGKGQQEYCRRCNPRPEGWQSEATSASQDKRKLTRPPPDEHKMAGVKEKVVWMSAQRDRRRKEESDSPQDCLCHGNTCGPLCDNPERFSVRERVMWKPEKRRHKKKEESEESYQDYLYHSNTCRTQRAARPSQDDLEATGISEVLKRHGKRGHSRREESDSSSHSNTGKIHRRTRSSHKPRQTVQEAKNTDTENKLRKRHESIKKDAGGHNKNIEELKGKNKKAATHRRAAIDVDSQGYAKNTVTSRLRTDHSHPRKKKEKENIVPYIPCGAKSHSYHVGVIAQQEMGRLISQPPQEHTHTHTKPQGSSRRESVAATSLTQDTVRQAMANLHHHLRSHSGH